MSYQARDIKARRPRKPRKRKEGFTPNRRQVGIAQSCIMAYLNKIGGCLYVSSAKDAVYQVMGHITCLRELGSDSYQQRTTIEHALAGLLDVRNRRLELNLDQGVLVSRDGIHRYSGSRRNPDRRHHRQLKPAYA